MGMLPKRCRGNKAARICPGYGGDYAREVITRIAEIMRLESVRMVAGLPHSDRGMVENRLHIDRVVLDVHVPDLTFTNPSGSLPNEVKSKLVGIFGVSGIVQALRGGTFRMYMDSQEVAESLGHQHILHDHLVGGATDCDRCVLDRKTVTEYLASVQHLRLVIHE